MVKNRLFSIFAVFALLATTLASGAGISRAADDTRTFPETGKTVSSLFLDYWDNHGGLAQQGYPISNEMQEVSSTDGKRYTVQYFERAVFELHPENAAPYDVLLSLLGVSFYADKYQGNAPGQKASTTTPRKFNETGKTIGGKFRTYWEKNGGLAQQGFPISEEFTEKNDADGKPYTVQYFERAVFELHPENAGKPSEVLLSLLGTFRYKGGSGSGGTTVTPPATSTSALAVKGWTHVVVFTNNVALFYNMNTHDVATARVNADGTLTTLRTKDQLVQFSTATQIVPGPQNTVFFYNRADGAHSLANVSDDGNVTTRAIYEPWSPGWTHIVIDTTTGLMLLYDAAHDTMRTSQLRLSDNFIIPLRNSPGNANLSEPRKRQFVPLGNGRWFFYLAEQIVGLTGSFTSAGDLANTKSSNVLSASWSHIVANGKFMLLYDKTKGKVATATIYPDGSFVPLKFYEGLSTEWTNFAAAPNGVFLIYSSETGNIATDQINNNGEELALKRYSHER